MARECKSVGSVLACAKGTCVVSYKERLQRDTGNVVIFERKRGLMWGVRREVVDEERSQTVKMSVKSRVSA